MIGIWIGIWIFGIVIWKIGNGIEMIGIEKIWIEMELEIGIGITEIELEMELELKLELE